MEGVDIWMACSNSSLSQAITVIILVDTGVIESLVVYWSFDWVELKVIVSLVGISSTNYIFCVVFLHGVRNFSVHHCHM